MKFIFIPYCWAIHIYFFLSSHLSSVEFAAIYLHFFASLFGTMHGWPGHHRFCTVHTVFRCFTLTHTHSPRARTAHTSANISCIVVRFRASRISLGRVELDDGAVLFHCFFSTRLVPTRTPYIVHDGEPAFFFLLLFGKTIWWIDQIEQHFRQMGGE